ncbi:MAG: proteasome accessory factor PafA2 family protein [Candidatus Xenobia bacterium]
MRDRVYGLETEYAVIYRPAAEDEARPGTKEIYDLFDEIVAARYQTIRTGPNKLGLFLQNGGLVQFEGSIHRADGLIEISTPECRTAKDAAAYLQAMDCLLMGVQEELNRKLAQHGYHGSVSFGKNSTDGKGNFYGTHENYYVADEPALPRMVMVPVLAVFTLLGWLIDIPTVWLPQACLKLFVLFVESLHACLCLLTVVPGLYKPLCPLLDHFDRVGNPLLGLAERLGVGISSLMHRLTWPFYRLFSGFLAATTLRRFTTLLAPYLITRVTWCGSGRALPEDDERAPFELMQRSSIVGSICTRCFDDRKMPLIDLKNFIGEAWSALRPQKRLQIVYSDSNMSEICTYLKLGVTGLLLQMIEEGHPLEDLAFLYPMQAVRGISTDLTLKKRWAMKNGESMTALEVQRYYLNEARKFYGEPGRESAEARDILQRWEYVLNCLDMNPELLYRDIDWIAKRDLLLEALKGEMGLEEARKLQSWAVEIKAARIGLDALAARPDKEISQHLQNVLPARTWVTLGHHLEYNELTWQGFIQQIQLPWQLQKIDMKYHEVSEDGYFYRMLRAGMTSRVTTDEEVERARTQAPAGTRASIRGWLVRRYASPGNVHASLSWSEFRAPSMHVKFEDPLQSDPAAIGLS